MHNVRQIAKSREGLVDVQNKQYVSYEDLARIVDDYTAKKNVLKLHAFAC